MTYRELLKLYQEGKLDEEQKQEVEQSVEKQEAISEYLYEKEEIPGLEALHEEEAPDAMTKENNAGAEEEQRFVNPHKHYMDMTPDYYDMKMSLLNDSRA